MLALKSTMGHDQMLIARVFLPFLQNCKFYTHLLLQKKHKKKHVLLQQKKHFFLQILYTLIAARQLQSILCLSWCLIRLRICVGVVLKCATN